MTLRSRSVVALAAVLSILVGCATTAPSPAVPSAPVDSGRPQPTVLPAFISTELAVGPNRFLFSFTDAAGNTPLGAPDRMASVAFSGPANASIASTPAAFIWAIEGVSGIYVASVDFPAAGDWIAEFATATTGKPEEHVSFQFQVLDKKHVIAPGDKAPSVDTPTLASVGGDVAKISTDPKPDPAFYETSIAAALGAHEPFVLVFATPKFCQTATCGPTLDKVKTVATAHPGLTFINVEPYKLKDVDGQLQPDLTLTDPPTLQTVPASDAYRLLSEPYVFVVGGDGIVTSSFELVFTPDEINAALTNLK